jgi:hypothetical protein
MIRAERLLSDVDRLDEYRLRVAVAPLLLKQIAEPDQGTSQVSRDAPRSRYSTTQTSNLSTTAALVHPICR